MRIPHRSTLATIAALALLAAAGGCGDSTGPASVNGRYTLRLIEGQPLPWLALETRTTEPMGSGSATIREYVDGATLVLLEPERDTLRLAWRTVTSVDGGAPSTTSAIVTVPYRLEGDRTCPSDTYDFDWPCGEGRPTVPRRGDSLFIALAPFAASPFRTFTFVREGR